MKTQKVLYYNLKKRPVIFGQLSFVLEGVKDCQPVRALARWLVERLRKNHCFPAPEPGNDQLGGLAVRISGETMAISPAEGGTQVYFCVSYDFSSSAGALWQDEQTVAAIRAAAKGAFYDLCSAAAASFSCLEHVAKPIAQYRA